MRTRRALLAAATATGLIWTSALGAWAAPPATSATTPTRAITPSATTPSSTTPSTTPTPASGQVTLVTGDRVRLVGGNPVVTPGPGRAGTHFVIDRSDGGLVVMPEETVPLIRQGTLDPRLFDVTALIRDGYDDAHRTSLPLILGYSAPDSAVSRRDRVAGTAAGLRLGRALPAVDGFVAEVPKRATAPVWRALRPQAARSAARPAAVRAAGTAPGLTRIWLDGRRRLLLDRSVGQIGAPAAYRAGFTGTGVTVAVLDSGIDTAHPDLADRVVASKNFSDEPDAIDHFGHGTHVASIIAGSGAASGSRYRGVAPDARLLNGKVCGGLNCDDSAILAGMQWAAVEQQADVVNMSLGDIDSVGVDPLEEAINTLSAQTGALFVVAAGNAGPAPGTISTPGTADAALSVGSVGRTGEVSDFSSRGPRRGDQGLKPEVTAPGEGIVAARAAGTELGRPVGDGYVALSGTSMATPHVAGAVALLAQQHPQWNGQRLKAALVSSARPGPNASVFDQGAGLIDLERAISLQLTGPVGVSFGLQRWPHADDEPLTRTVTYANEGPTAVDLQLTLSTVGPDPDRPATGVFSTSRPSVTVPAGGTASVDVVADTRADGPDGVYTGVLTAAAGSQSLTTPLVVVREAESYDLTTRFIDRSGKPAARGESFIVRLDAPFKTGTGSTTGSSTIRLPKGRYDVMGMPNVPGGATRVLHVAQGVDLSRDTVLTFDGRTAKPVSLRMPDAGAEAVMGTLEYVHETPRTVVDFLYLGPSTDALFIGTTTFRARPGERSYSVLAGEWNSSQKSGPVIYGVSKRFDGKLPGGYRRTYRSADLATVRDRIAAQRPGDGATIVNYPDGNIGLQFARGQVSLPVTLTRRLSTDDGVRWAMSVMPGPVVDGDVAARTILAGVSRFRTGKPVTQQWNRGPFGPSFVPGISRNDFVVRSEDTITVDTGMLFGDSGGHNGRPVDTPVTVSLYRDGTLLDTSDSDVTTFPVPAAAARYRVDVTVAGRPDLPEMPAEVRASWTFRSAPVPSTGPVPVLAGLPVVVVRTTPKAAADGTVAAGRATVPVAVQVHPGTRVVGLRLGTVEVSFDAGRTWRPAPLHRTGATRGTVSLNHRAGATVSLRTTATGLDGVHLTQTVIGAYRVRGPASPS